MTELSWQRDVAFRLAPQPLLPATVPAGAVLALQVEFGPATTPGPYEDYLLLKTKERVVANLAVQARM